MDHPIWLSSLATLSLATGVIGAGLMITVGPAARMPIMRVVRPLTVLWAGGLAIYAYLSKSEDEAADWRVVARATTHCGSGCTLGDIVAESVTAFMPLTLFGYPMFGTWILDFVFAFGFGLLFQYFTIKPMRHLTIAHGLKAAFQADALSLIAWQVGMYGWMAFATFFLFGHELKKSDVVFWFMMQIAMAFGFMTSYPVNWWLVARGLKERM